MKILHFALLAPNSPQWGLRHALRQLADDPGADSIANRKSQIANDYREFNWYPHWADGNLRELRDGFVELARAMRPDLCFCQIQTPNLLPGALLKLIRDVCPFVMSWCGDLRDETPAWACEAAPHLDLHTFSNGRDVDVIRQRGCAAEFLNIGFSTHVFQPDGPKRANTPEVVFLGTNYGNRFPRSSQRQKMVAHLRARYGKRFGVFGGGWGPSDPFLQEPEEAACYRSCKVAINQNHYDDVPRFSSDRILRAMGSGACVVSNTWPGLEKDFCFADSVEKAQQLRSCDLVTWLNGDFDDLCRKIDWLLEHDDHRRAIGETGCRHVHENHSWQARMRDIAGFLGKYQRKAAA